QLLVTDLRIIPAAPEMLTQFFAQIHRAVLPAGTAHRDRDVAAVVGLETRQPLFQVAADVREHLGDIGLLLQKVDDRLIQAAAAPQVLYPIGIGEAAGIEHDIGIHRYAVLEAE